jgi:hypothetical protein
MATRKNNPLRSDIAKMQKATKQPNSVRGNDADVQSYIGKPKGKVTK